MRTASETISKISRLRSTTNRNAMKTGTHIIASATAHNDLLDQNTRRLEERQHNDASYFKHQLWFLQRLVQSALPGTEQTPGATQPGTDAPAPSAPGEHELDALYLAFEEAMRGNRREVKERTRVYLPYISAANAGTPERPLLDLGCGRGEWLEVLGEQGMVASGVDLNTCMIDLCRERGLSVTLTDALDHLRTCRTRVAEQSRRFI